MAGGGLDGQTLREHAFDEALMECARFMGVAWPLPATHDLATLATGRPHETVAPAVAPGSVARASSCDIDTNVAGHAHPGDDLGDGSFSRAPTYSGGGRDTNTDNGGAHIVGMGVTGLSAYGGVVDPPDADRVIVVDEVSARVGRRRRRHAGYEDGTAGPAPCDQGRNAKRSCIGPIQARGHYRATGREDDGRSTSNLGSASGRCNRCATVDSPMCTHGMCGVHCRARQRLIGPTHGRCASVLHRVLVWREQCAVAECRGRTSIGCIARLCTRHCVASSPVAVACGNITHRKAIRKSRRVAAAR